MSTVDDEYPCVAVCMFDKNGYCMGCGRPSSHEELVTQVDGAAAKVIQPPAEAGSVKRAD